MKYVIKTLKGLFYAIVAALAAATWAIPFMATAQYTPAVAWRIIGSALVPANTSWTVGRAIAPIVNGYFTDLNVVNLNGSTPCVSSGSGCPTLASLGMDLGAGSGAGPYAMAADDYGYIWVTNDTDGTISKVDATTGVATTTVTVGTNPDNILYANGYIWVSNNGNNRISKVSVTSSSVLASIPTAVAPYGLAWDGTYVWVAQGGGTGATVAKISVTSTRIVATSTVAVSPRAIHYFNGQMWVGNYTTKSIKVVATTTNAVVATIAIANQPIAITDDGTNVYVAQYTGATAGINVINPLTYVTTATTTGPIGGTTDLGYYNGYVWGATNANDTVIKISTTTKQIVAHIPVGDGPQFLLQNGNYLWVTETTSKRIRRLYLPNY